MSNQSYLLRVFGAFPLSCLLILSSFFSTQANAILLPVANPSFELDPLPAGSFSLSIPQGWDSDFGVVGYVDGGSPGDGVFPTPDGTTQAAISNEARRGSGGLFQVLTSTIEADTLYTLTVDVGDGLFTNFPPTVEVRLGAGDFWNTNLLPSQTIIAPIPFNGWETWEVTYNSNDFSQYVGESLRIELMTDAIQALFDNVRLDASPAPAVVPEASTVGYLVGVMAMALVYRVRKNRMSLSK